MAYHVVKQGECMSGIADTYGFFWQALWDHPNNAQLKEKRRNPNVLMRGDQVFIPDKRVKEEQGSTAQTHTFRLKGIPCRFNLRLQDAIGKPRAGIRYTLVVDGKKTTGSTGGDGLLSEIVSPNANQAVLTLHLGDGREEKYSLDLAYLNPADHASGAQARLKNLGYHSGEISGQMDEGTRKALGKFQQDAGLPVTRELDDATRDELVRRHGS
ncbi:MAG: peptidoglycan-binding domain-containing protein [Bryobacteraceae bacterium]|jgi:N-acetylmuramoyl-L-alanine amidase